MSSYAQLVFLFIHHFYNCCTLTVTAEVFQDLQGSNTFLCERSLGDINAKDMVNK